jgi:tetratricopeptide (TPR) repeat protein
MGELLLHETQFRKPANLWVRFKLWRAARLFREVLRALPNDWRSMWQLGKTIQRLGDEEAAFGWFEKAWDLKPKNADVAREAALSAMHLGLGQHAIEYSEEALRIEPDEPGLVCNLALSLLHAGRPQQALEKVQEAVRLDKNDKVSENTLRVIRHIAENKAACPQNSAALQTYCKQHREIFH